MAAYKNTYQHEHTTSIPRSGLIEIAEDQDLSKNDLRVLLMLLSALDGFTPSPQDAVGTKRKDPLNFRAIDIAAIADSLNLKKKIVRKCIDKFLDLDYLEEGSNEHVANGYRFKI